MKKALLGVLTGNTQASLLAENEETTAKPSLQDIFANIYDATIEMTVSFDNYDAFKDDADYASLITSGTVTVTLIPGRGDLTSKKLEGTYKISTSSADPIVVLTEKNELYTISFENFAGSFTLDGTNGADITIPAEEDDSINISIAAGKGTPVTLNWKDDIASKIEENSNFSDYTAEQLDAEYFYQHFGSLRFLNALYSAFTSETAGVADDKHDNLKITDFTKENGISLEEGENSTKTLTLTVDFGDGYRYYRGSDSYQTVSGKVTFIFTGTVENSEFKATSFTVDAKSLSLSDSSTDNKRPAATATITKASGKFGEGKEGYITFTLKTGTEDGESVVTGITNYKDSYNDDNNEFVLTAEGGITSIAITLK